MLRSEAAVGGAIRLSTVTGHDPPTFPVVRDSWYAIHTTYLLLSPGEEGLHMRTILEQPESTINVHYVALSPENRVEEFLATHPNVQQYLLDAREPLYQAFGKDIDQVSVVATTNPEMMDGEFLVCRIQTTLPAEQALARLHTFDESWDLENSHRVEGRVIFNVTFPRP